MTTLPETLRRGKRLNSHLPPGNARGADWSSASILESFSCRSMQNTQVKIVLVAFTSPASCFACVVRSKPLPHPFQAKSIRIKRGVGSSPRLLRETSEVDRRATSNGVAELRHDGRASECSSDDLAATGCVGCRSTRWTRRTWWSVLHRRPGVGHSRQNIFPSGRYRKHRHLRVLQVVQTLRWNQQDGSS